MSTISFGQTPQLAFVENTQDSSVSVIEINPQGKITLLENIKTGEALKRVAFLHYD